MGHRQSTVTQYAKFLEYAMQKKELDFADEIAKAKVSYIICAALLRTGYIEKSINKGLHVWVKYGNPYQMAIEILKYRDNKKMLRKEKQYKIEFKTQSLPNKLTVQQCINFLKSQTDYTYEIYRIERNQL
jgi:hypothetical protein